MDYAKSNGIKVISWDEIPKYRFDFINTEQVFEHLAHPLKTLCYLKTSLNKDGLIKLSVPNARNIEHRLKIMDWKSSKDSKNSLNPVAPLEHINFFRRKSLIKMASIAGMKEIFIPIKVQYRYTTNWDGVWGFAKNILMPLYRNLLKKQNYIFLRNI